jgi:hypothetical protein
MKRLVIIAVVFLLAAFGAQAAVTDAANPHNLSSSGTSWISTSTTTRVCVFCHTPHNASGTTGPLWNKAGGTSTNYTNYGNWNGTINASLGTWNGGSDVGSALCMSCHDGTVAVGSTVNNGDYGVTATMGSVNDGDANLGLNLQDDHPVNFTYDSTLASADGDLATPSSSSLVTTGIPLFGGTLQCGSCHDVHEYGLTAGVSQPFLRIANTNSALCDACHNK